MVRTLGREEDRVADPMFPGTMGPTVGDRTPGAHVLAVQSHQADSFVEHTRDSLTTFRSLPQEHHIELAGFSTTLFWPHLVQR